MAKRDNPKAKPRGNERMKRKAFAKARPVARAKPRVVAKAKPQAAKGRPVPGASAKLVAAKAKVLAKLKVPAKGQTPVKLAGKDDPAAKGEAGDHRKGKLLSPAKGERIPRLKVNRAKAREAERALLERAAQKPEDAEVRRTRLKNLIKLGKERGYLTYAEINDHLPEVVDAEQIESMITTFNDMGIQVFDEAPDTETLLMSEATPTAAQDEDVEEEAEAAMATVDPEFGRTTDPVRMYMREMGSVELLTREGEIEIAKRIEDGLKQMIMAISALPTTIVDILELADKVKRDEMRIDELVDGLVDPNAKDEPMPEMAEEAELDDEEDEETEEGDASAALSASMLQLKEDALERYGKIHRLFEKLKAALAKHGHKSKEYIRVRDQISNELMNIRFTARIIEKLCDSVRGMVDQVRRHERRIQALCVEKGGMPRPHFIKVFPSSETSIRWIKN